MKHWKLYSYVLFLLFIILCILLVINQTLAQTAVAIGTLILASATALSVIYSNLKEKRLRRENLLNEILEWGIDVAKSNFKIFNLVEAQVSDEPWVPSSLGEIVSEFQVLEVRGEYVRKIAAAHFKENKKLKKAINTVKNNLRRLGDTTIQRIDHKVPSDVVQKEMNSLRLDTTTLLKEVALIKKP